MMTRIQMTCLFALACAVGGVAAPAAGENSLMILVERSHAGEGAFKYDFGFSLARDAATSCAITIGSQTYGCSQMDGGWFPEARFWEENGSLTEAALRTLLVGSWIITWNGGSSPTIAVVTFGSTWIDDFPPLPIITSVSNDAPSRGSVHWEVNPGSVGINYFAVDVVDSQDWEIQAGPLATECSFDLPVDGNHTVRVAKVHERIGDVSTDIQIQQGNWELGPGGWFEYWCVDERPFQVREGVSIQEASWGFLKALYR